MNKLLIVEDEAMIRKGLRTIISRSDVTVGEIIECKNGVEALAILTSQQIDVMFTDIRMPKMDGLELLKWISELFGNDKPEIVIISGYDDFNYAVEAMHCGAREYILKPVLRNRVFELMRKLDAAVENKKMEAIRHEQIEKLSQQQLKYMLYTPDISDNEIASVQDAFHDLLGGRAYVVLCTNQAVELPKDSPAIHLGGINPFHIYLLHENTALAFAEEYMNDLCVGASQVYKDLSDFRRAHEEAVEARKYAFYSGKPFISFSAKDNPGAQAVPSARTPQQMAHQVGSSQYAELVHMLSSLVDQTATEKLSHYGFEKHILGFLEAVEEMLASDNRGDHILTGLKQIYGYDSVDTYRLALLDWLDNIHVGVVASLEKLRNRERMEVVLNFIHENFGECDLSMAVVSNHISMHYSAFSQMFKDFTGQNFVDYLRDLRISKAKELLVETDWKVSQISEAVGYENDKYFMRTFKAVQGISPTEYRNSEKLLRMNP